MVTYIQDAGGTMTDQIIARFRASHSARGMQLSARQAGIMKPKETESDKLAMKAIEQLPQEEADIQ
ncbi:MAG: hypothetical protein JWL89_368 [Candidatus Saccharibacteria bacterium]|jgi:hypothetical protein|nr:hypothetical protein [Candidatus Saccharibacteria bacterium]